MGKIILLDLEREPLLGWEPEKKFEDIQGLISRIKMGQKFEPIPVHLSSDGPYYLSILRENGNQINSRVDGGHKRSVAHYISRYPLRAELLDQKDPYWPSWENPIEIKDIRLI